MPHPWAIPLNFWARPLPTVLISCATSLSNASNNFFTMPEINLARRKLRILRVTMITSFIRTRSSLLNSLNQTPRRRAFSLNLANASRVGGTCMASLPLATYTLDAQPPEVVTKRLRDVHGQNFLLFHEVPQLNGISMLSMRAHKAYGVPHIELKYRTKEQ